MPEIDLTKIELSSVCVRSNEQDSNSESKLPEEVNKSNKNNNNVLNGNYFIIFKIHNDNNSLLEIDTQSSTSRSPFSPSLSSYSAKSSPSDSNEYNTEKEVKIMLCNLTSSICKLRLIGISLL